MQIRGYSVKASMFWGWEANYKNAKQYSIAAILSGKYLPKCCYNS